MQKFFKIAFYGSAMLSLALLAWNVRTGLDQHELVALAVSTALVFASQFLTVDLSTRTAPGVYWSIRSAIHMSVLFVVDPWIAVLAGVASSILFDLIGRRRPIIVVDNASSDLMALAIASQVFVVLGGHSGAIDLPTTFVPMIGAMLAYALGVSGSYLMAVVADSELPAVALRNEKIMFLVNVRLTVMECLMGIALAITWMLDPWAVIVVVPLAVSVFHAVSGRTKTLKITELALESFANIVDERDPYTAMHSSNVCDYSMMIGEKMGLDSRRMNQLYWTSRLHDLGKVAVDNSILNKPGRLTEEEFEIMKSHPVVSARILSSFKFNEYDTDVVLCHHERYDGRGYLKRERETVPLEAFIIAVADSFDAMTTDRPYRNALPHEVALEEIHRNIGTQFHPEAARVFLEAMNFTVGTDAETESATPHVGLGESAGLGALDRESDERKAA